MAGGRGEWSQQTGQHGNSLLTHTLSCKTSHMTSCEGGWGPGADNNLQTSAMHVCKMEVRVEEEGR